MSDLFGRKIEFLYDRYKITNELTIYFDVPFDDEPDANIAEIKIYNLSTSTINTIKKGQSVTLNAGYTNDVGAILKGKIQGIFTEPQGVDRITHIYVIDAEDIWMEKQVKRTYKQKTTAKQILNDLLRLSGLKVGALSLPKNFVYKSGKTINDKLGKAIIDVAKDCGAKVYITRGKIYIQAKDQAIGPAIEINKNTGLITSPTPIEKEETLPDGKKRVKKGYKITTLLNNKIQTDSLVHVKSKTANGKFRVEKGRHYCDGDKFYTEMEVYPL